MNENGFGAWSELAADLAKIPGTQLFVLVACRAAVCPVPECRHLFRVRGEVGNCLGFYARLLELKACLSDSSTTLTLETGHILIKTIPDDGDYCRRETKKRVKTTRAKMLIAINFRQGDIANQDDIRMTRPCNVLEAFTRISRNWGQCSGTAEMASPRPATNPHSTVRICMKVVSYRRRVIIVSASMSDDRDARSMSMTKKANPCAFNRPQVRHFKPHCRARNECIPRNRIQSVDVVVNLNTQHRALAIFESSAPAKMMIKYKTLASLVLSRRDTGSAAIPFQLSSFLIPSRHTASFHKSGRS